MSALVRGRGGARFLPEEFVLFDEVMHRVDAISAEAHALNAVEAAVELEETALAEVTC